MNRFGMDQPTLITATGRLYLMPIFAFLVLNLIKDEKDFNTIILLYTLFIFLASLSLFISIFLEELMLGSATLK